MIPLKRSPSITYRYKTQLTDHNAGQQLIFNTTSTIVATNEKLLLITTDRKKEAMKLHAPAASRFPNNLLLMAIITRWSNRKKFQLDSALQIESVMDITQQRYKARF